MGTGLARVLGGEAGIAVSLHPSLPDPAPPASVTVICARETPDVASACRRAAESAAREVVVVLDRPTPELLLECLDAGARGFVFEHDGPGELLRAVKTVADGDYHLGPGPLSLLLDWYRTRRELQTDGARTRDRDLLGLLVAGRTTEEIAERLGIAPKTVRNNTSLLYRRLGVRSRAQAARVAEERGLLD
jgi:DNA-binding NarL/FixJ family response regulator